MNVVTVMFGGADIKSVILWVSCDGQKIAVLTPTNRGSAVPPFPETAEKNPPRSSFGWSPPNRLCVSSLEGTPCDFGAFTRFLCSSKNFYVLDEICTKNTLHTCYNRTYDFLLDLNISF